MTGTLSDTATAPRHRAEPVDAPVPVRRRGRAPGRRRPRLPVWSARDWLVAALVGLLVLFGAALVHLSSDPAGRELGLDDLATATEAGQVERARFLDEDARVVGTTRGGEAFWVAYPASDSATATLLTELTASGAEVSVDAQPGKAVTRIVVTGLLPLVILAALFGLFFVGGRDGGVSGIRGFGTLGKRDGGLAAPPAVTFADVAGADEAVAELREVVEYLGDPDRYAALGASPPKGVLLFGPPGTGKTLIARATAGEAGVPFFSVAGAEFVESLVGVGAARIRDLFASVRAVAPAIVFIDELDAAGRRRGGAETGGSEEREQTLNQLLVELDGFAASSGVVVMGATNRPDILDPALLRPGRFDRHVTVDHPDRAGRERILAVHTRGKPLADVDLAVVARRTPGFTGADLANVVNEAALLAIRDRRSRIGMADLVEAIERVLGGPQRRGRLLGADVRRRIAAHEAGHAVVAAATGQEVHRISVVSRGSGLGAVGLAGGDEAAVLTEGELADRITVAMSGRAAEELLLGSPSTGSEGDLERATAMARDMVTRYGLGPSVGRVRLAAPDTDVYLGARTATGDLSEELRRRVEQETAQLVDTGFARAGAVLVAERARVERLVAALLVEESLDGPALEDHLRDLAATSR